MNEIAKSAQVNQLIDRMSPQFAKVLPKVLPPERFCRVVLTALNKNPALVEALTDKRNQSSVLSAFMQCAELGIEPDGRRATINCYKKGTTGRYDVTLIPMYQGLCELAMRSGLISSIHADKVCENDQFEWNTGEITHKIDFRKPRGNAYAFYCRVQFKDGSVKTETMGREEIDRIMGRSSAFIGAKKFGKSCPWMTDYEEMAKKTVFRRCAKWLPLSPEQRQAIEFDDADYVPEKPQCADQFAANAGVVEPAPLEPINAEDVIDVEDKIDVGADAPEVTEEEAPKNLFEGN